MELSLTGKEALICGSTQGIGLAIAKELALLGANCTLLARNETALQQSVLQLAKTSGQEHRYRVADFQYPEQVKEIIAEHTKQFPVHILVTIPAVRPRALLPKLPENNLSVHFSNILFVTSCSRKQLCHP